MDEKTPLQMGFHCIWYIVRLLLYLSMEIKHIQESIGKFFFEKGHHSICFNFVGSGYHEADVITITPSGIVYEVEIKRSRADFKKDFKKEQKHFMLSSGFVLGEARIPNHFYYGCEPELIKLEEIPKYSGLIWIAENGSIEIIKKAPLLHKDKASQELKEKIIQVFTERAIFGTSYMRYLAKKGKRIYTNFKRKSHG